MDEIEKRLRDVSETCVKTYLAWIGKKRDPETREALQDAIHELRRVSARLEIKIAVSEREEMAARPIPIPPHRSTRTIFSRLHGLPGGYAARHLLCTLTLVRAS